MAGVGLRQNGFADLIRLLGGLRRVSSRVLKRLGDPIASPITPTDIRELRGLCHEVLQVTMVLENTRPGDTD